MATQPDYAPQDDSAGSGAMSDAELVAHLEEHEKRAIGYYDSEIAGEQEEALNRYYRRPYGDEQAGRSKVVDPTVSITIDNAVAAVVKPFVSQDDVVEFEPVEESDEDGAKQATEYANFVFYKDNPGFTILLDWFKDALLQKNGVVKVYWENYIRDRVTRLENLDPVQLQAIMAEERVVDGPFGPDENGLFVLDVMRTEQDGKCCVENVPPEEHRISPLARKGRIPPYEAHVTTKPRSELIEMGFDYDVVMALSKFAHTQTEDGRAQARRQDELDISYQLSPPGDASRELVAFNDELVLVDYDGDGVSEWRRIMRSGNIILYNEEVEFGMFAKLCPVPMPHKVIGRSLADQCEPEARIATVLTRQTLDNLYLSNNPRPLIGEGAERTDNSTIDDLSDDSPGAAIRVRDISQMGQFAVPFVADKSFPMLDYIGKQAEATTGISKQGQGLDPEAIDKSNQITATHAAILEDGRNERAELIARIFAETGVKDLFKLILKNLVAHQPRARVIRLRKEWVQMDPRHWNAEMDLTISVGLGMGNKAEQIAVADGVLQTMAELGQTPFSSLIDKEKVYNAVKRKFSAAGIKNIDDFLVEPERDEQGNVVPEEPQPSPEMIKAQMDMQIEQMKAQQKAQADQAESERKLVEMQQKIQIEQAKLEAQQRLAEQKAQFEAALARQEFEFERQMALREQAFEERMSAISALREADRKDEETKMKANRPGGKLNE